MKNINFSRKKSSEKVFRIAKVLILCMLICIPYTYAGSSAGQAIEVSGVVQDESNEALIGVGVLIKGTTTGTSTDVNGRFSLQVPNQDAVLEFSYLGHDTHEARVGNQTNFLITLSTRASALDEVVVMGYGVQKKKLVTGATVQVRGDDIEKLNTVSALAALQSQTPGVNITQSSGMPGEGHKVVIRGIGTIGNSSPLYVIDGSPGGDITNLNPSDIESVDVLKDAASAAIYGARGANGVIIVTTKKGAVGKPRITFDAYYGVQNIYKTLDVLDAGQYATLMNETRLMDNMPAYNFEPLVPRWSEVEDGSWKGTNWLDEARNKNAPIQNYSFGVSGGTEQSVYSIGFTYTHQEGIYGVEPNNSEFSRYTARVNSEHVLYRANGLDVVKLGENITYTHREVHGLAIGDMWYNDIRNLAKTPPFMSLNDEDGGYATSIPWETRDSNPIGVMVNRSHHTNKRHNIRSNFFLTVQPIKNLVIRSNFGYNLSGSSYRSFSPLYYLSPVNENVMESVSQSMSLGHSYTLENTINYTFSLNDEHNFDILVGQSIEKGGGPMGESLNAANAYPIFHDLEHAYVGNTTLSTITSSTRMGGSAWGMSRMASFFGRLNYDYKNKYMFSAIMRADGSSNFARGNRWGYFPSFSAGWVLTEEPFMKPLRSAVDFLKIRASWGQNGNHSIGAFQYLATIRASGTGAAYFFGKDKTSPTTGAYADILPNPDVTWETSQQTNIGLDAYFLDNRLGFVFDWYIKKTKDWLLVAPQLATNGTGAPYVNGGDIENKGIEIGLSWNDNIRDFRYGVNFNMSHNRNEVTRIANEEGIIPGATDALFQASGEAYRVQVGQPVGFFYGYKTAGVFQSAEEVANYKGAKLDGAREGDVIWVDRNNDGKITQEDRGKIGNPHPKFTMGFSLNASYFGFDISATLYSALGHQILQSYRSWSDSPKDNHTTKIFGRWHGPGTSNKYPRLTTQSHTNWTYVSDLYVENGDYLRLQNLTIGYDFKHLFPKMFLGQARIYFTAQNLFTITGYSGMDPEVGYGHGRDYVSGVDVGFYPSPRTFLFGVNLKF